MATKRIFIKADQRPTSEQLREVDNAAKYEINTDDIPEISDEQFAAFARLADERRRQRRKQVVSLRLSPETLSKAKKVGKGYTRFLSSLLDMAINDPEMVRKCL